MVRVCLRRRQGTDGPFKATQGSAQRPREAWRGWSGARLRAPRRHRCPSARRGPTPTGGRRSARGARARGDATGRQGRGEPVGDGQAVGWLGLKEAGREGSSGFSAPAICWVVTRFSPRQEQPPGEGGGSRTLPPSSQQASASSRARLSRTAAGHQLHAPRHVGACTTTWGRGKGARGPKRLSPWPALRLPASPDPASPHSPPLPLTRVGLDVLPQEVAAGEMLEARSEERRVGKECRSRWSPYH